MTRFLNLAITFLICAASSTAQENTCFSPEEQEMIDLSEAKWKWMSEKLVLAIRRQYGHAPHSSMYWTQPA